MPLVNLKLFFLLKMITVGLLIATALAVAGSKIEATDGQNVTIYFNIDEVEKADLVRISFKGDNEGKRLIAQIPWRSNIPPPSGVSMDVGKGRVCVTIQKVSSSSSGLYEARAFFREKMSEVKVQLVVKEAPVSTSPAPEHPPTPKPPTSDLLWLTVIPPVMIIVIISGVVCFWRCRKIQRRQKKKLKNNSNASGGNAEALLAVKTHQPCSNHQANSKSISV